MRHKVLDMIVKYPNRTAPFYCENLERVAPSESIGYAISDPKKKGLVYTTGRSGKYVLDAPTTKGIEVIERKTKYFKCPIKECREEDNETWGEVIMKLVTVLLPESYLEGLHELVRENVYPSRSEAIRMAVRDLVKKELWGRKRSKGG